MKLSPFAGFAALPFLLAGVAGAAPDAPFRTIVPIVLDVDSNGSHFSTELSVANTGMYDAVVTFRYVASLGDARGSGSFTETIPAGRQFRWRDAIATLRGKGLKIPLAGAQGGPLVIESDRDNILATARTATAIASPSGRAGLAYVGLAEDEGRTRSATVYGLRSTVADRSNLAVFSTSVSGVTLKVTAFDGESGASAVVEEARELPPFGWYQYNEVLRRVGFTNGWVVVERTDGVGSFSAYGVVNDNRTGDGSYIAPAPSSAAGTTMTVPVLVEAGAFLSELVLANRGSATARLTLSYVESLSPASGPGGTLTLDLPPGRQQIVPDALEYLRGRGLGIGPKGSGSHAGSLRVAVAGSRSTRSSPGRGPPRRRPGAGSSASSPRPSTPARKGRRGRSSAAWRRTRRTGRTSRSSTRARPGRGRSGSSSRSTTARREAPPSGTRST